MNIEKFFMKNKYILLSILVIIIFFYFVTPPFFHFFPAFAEGFTVDEYKYLAPPPADYTWSQDTITKFTEKINMLFKDEQGNKPATEEDVKNIYIKSYGVTEEEAKYYIQNANWPYDAYIMNYLKQNPDLISKMKQDDGSPQTLSNLSKYWPNRLVYGQLIGTIESTQNPQPLSYQIFMGTASDPDQNSQTNTDISPITSSSLSSASTLSESNYNTLVSLCKNIIPV